MTTKTVKRSNCVLFLFLFFGYLFFGLDSTSFAQTVSFGSAINYSVGANPHSVAVDDTNNHVFVPISSNAKTGCGGCVEVFAPK